MYDDSLQRTLPTLWYGVKFIWIAQIKTISYASLLLKGIFVGHVWVLYKWLWMAILPHIHNVISVFLMTILLPDTRFLQPIMNCFQVHCYPTLRHMHSYSNETENSFVQH